MFTNEIRPYKSHADHRDKSCDAVHITHMGILDVEAGRFHGSKGRFYLPSFFVCQNRLLGPIEAYENLQFRNTIGREFGIRNTIKKLNRQLEKAADSFGNITDI